MFQGRNISFTVNDRKILDDISVNIFPGKITVIAGANGAGKSTLLKTLTGDINRHSGKVMLNGDSISAYEPRKLAKMRAVLPQKTNLSLPFSALEVVLLGRTPHGTSASENLAIAELVMKETDVAHLSHRVYQTLSGGEQQRVHLARVLAQLHGDHQHASYLLLDEPTSSLDIAQQHGLLGMVRRRCRESGLGVAAVIHDLSLAAQYADYLLFMKDGREVAQGPAGMMLRQDIIEYTFSYPVKLIDVPGAGVPLIHAGASNQNENASAFEENINYTLNGKLGY